jgi:hypothetical protein
MALFVNHLLLLRSVWDDNLYFTANNNNLIKSRPEVGLEDVGNQESGQVLFLRQKRK